jgi:NADPH:quinone reductase-like Zn-dependent oxidoreductase
MRTYRLRGDTAGEDRLHLEDAPEPRIGPRDVLVEIRAVALNYRDLMVVDGRYAHGAVRDGLVPCSDGAGTVVAIGDEVDRVAVGDRVAGLFMPRWLGGPFEDRFRADALGGDRDGVLAERVRFDQEAVVRVPDHLSLAEAATLPCAALTAWNALLGGTPLVPGESVLIEGTGGVSLFALGFAQMAGARTVLVTTSPDKAGPAAELGAASVIVARDDTWPEAVRQASGGGVDHVVEVVGGGNVALSAAAARNGAQMHLIGAQQGGQVDPAALRRRNLAIRGIYVGCRSQFLAMNRAIALHRYQPRIDRTYRFDAAAEAYRHLRAGSHVGKVVIARDAP